MAKRREEMKALEMQLKDLDEKPHSKEFGDVFIHSMIHTIEFVLGTVSNTASYLRLWALSLAHGQLAEVFFNLCFSQFVNVFHMESYLMTGILALVIFPVFWSTTFGIIMCMDALECSLHTLRLHWVEF